MWGQRSRPVSRPAQDSFTPRTRSTTLYRLLLAIVLLLLLFSSAPVAAQAPVDDVLPDPLAGQLGTDQTGQDILDMDIEQLSRVDVVVPSLDMEVSTVSRQESTVGRSPAAVFVITPEMIRRSGAQTIPDLLRLVPGMDVASIDSNKWAVSCRGFNGLYAAMLLVQIDGRSVYTPMFAGVYWDAQDVVLADIKRIEVIRGPGSTVWGANAVNGVVNIITKNAHNTQGPYLKVGGGTYERDFGTVRFGTNNGRGLALRAYGKYFNRGDGYAPWGAQDDWQVGRGGFRSDWNADRCDIDKFTFQGDYYDGFEGNTITLADPVFPFQQTISRDFPNRGGNLLARWTHTYDEDSDFALQFYYDWYARNDMGIFSSQTNIYDIDFQHRFALNRRHHVIWGLGFRNMRINGADTFSMALIPNTNEKQLYSAFIQDEITLVEDRLWFTAGCKGERNGFTGYVFQPTGRFVYMPSNRASAWAAFSRAVRTPSFAEESEGYLRAPPVVPGTPSFPLIYGNTNFRNETVLAYELGYRAQPTDSFSWDVAAFYNVYDDLRTLDFDPYPPSPFLPPRLRMGNRMAGETYGAELTWKWDVHPRWQVSGYYAFLRMQLHADPVALPTGEDAEGYSPRNQAFLWSSWDLGHDVDFDALLRYVDNLPTLDVPSYISLDLRLAWHPRENLEMSVFGKNLLDNHRPEYGDEMFSPWPTEVRRSVYGMVTWEY